MVFSSNPTESTKMTFRFVNIVWVVAMFVVLVSVVGLIAIYVVPIVAKLPKALLEGFLWSLCFSGILSGKSLFVNHPSIGLFIAFTGCIGMIGAYAYSLAVHAKAGQDTKLALTVSMKFP